MTIDKTGVYCTVREQVRNAVRKGGLTVSER